MRIAPVFVLAFVFGCDSGDTEEPEPDEGPNVRRLDAGPPGDGGTDAAIVGDADPDISAADCCVPDGSESDLEVPEDASDPDAAPLDGGGGDGPNRGPAPGPGELVVTEVMYDPHDPLNDDAAEWVELTSTADGPRGLDGCVLADAGGEASLDGLRLEAGGVLLLGRTDDVERNGGITPDGLFRFGLNNGGDTVAVRCDGRLIDEIVYDSGGAFPEARRRSISLDTAHTNAADNDDGAHWCGGEAVYFEGDLPHLGTPGEANPPCFPPVEIRGCQLRPPVELEAQAGVPVLLAGTPEVDGEPRLRAEAGYGRAGTPPDRDGWVWQPAAPIEDEPGVYGATVVTPRPGAHAWTLRFGGEGGDDWTFCAPGSLVSTPAFLCEGGCGRGEVCDRDGCVAAVKPEAPGQVLFSELMIDPAGALDDDAEWIELRNVTGTALSLFGCTISNADGAQTLVDRVVPAGGHLLLGRTDDPARNGGLATDAFFGFALEDVGTLTLACGGLVLDVLAYDAEFPVVQRAAIALDKGREDAGANDDPESWCRARDVYFEHAATPHFGTPGVANPPCPPETPPGAADAVLFTEILYDPHDGLAEDAAEWVELHNPTDEAVDLSGCTLGDLVGVVELAFVLEAGAYAVLARSVEPAENGGLQPVAVFDFGLNNGGDTLTLRCDDEVVDSVSYDDGPEFPDARGASISLDPERFDPALNDAGAAWCLGVDLYFEPEGGAPHFGTPGGPNPACDDVVEDPCVPNPCADGEQCVDGDCVAAPDPCDPNPCAEGERCVGGECEQPDACAGVMCGEGEVCAGGVCVGPGRAPAAGELQISEVMYDPHDGLADNTAEWVELHNASDAVLELAGCELTDARDESPAMLDARLPADGYAVFARSADPALNGGLAVDGTFAFALGNGGDTVRVRCGGNELDAVAYDDGDLFPDARRASISRDDADRWCLGVDVYLPAGNGVDEHYGTPGAANPECPAE